MAARYWNRYYKPAKPRQTDNGIKAKSKRGAFGQSWWAKRWIEVIESFNIGARLGRGRSYARTGQVLSIDIRKGLIEAKVQGSRAKPYNVSIQVATISDKGWSALEKVLAGKAAYLAKLLAGELPEGMETVFKEAGLSLFPDKRGDLKTECSCPDWSNPCKHIAAVYFLIGEEFDRDPFLILKLRGMERDELLSRTCGLGKGKTNIEGVRAKTPGTCAKNMDQTAPPEPLPLEADLFWEGQGSDNDVKIDAETPRLSGALAKRLGNFPFWRGHEDFLTTLERIYDSASHAGLEMVAKKNDFSAS
jgi:uncharacterized Zn finger protein